jgi:serine/threonine protein phosphatase PrpC
VEPDLAGLDSEPGDILLFTSDGLTRYRNISDSQISPIVVQTASPEAACEALIQAVRDNGGSDNITRLSVHL